MCWLGQGPNSSGVIFQCQCQWCVWPCFLWLSLIEWLIVEQTRHKLPLSKLKHRNTGVAVWFTQFHETNITGLELMSDSTINEYLVNSAVYALTDSLVHHQWQYEWQDVHIHSHSLSNVHSTRKSTVCVHFIAEFMAAWGIANGSKKKEKVRFYFTMLRYSFV